MGEKSISISEESRENRKAGMTVDGFKQDLQNIVRKMTLRQI